MRNAKDFLELKKKKEGIEVNKYIEENVYTKLDYGEYPVIIALNKLEQDDIFHREFITALHALGFKCMQGKQGIDKIIKITIDD